MKKKRKKEDKIINNDAILIKQLLDNGYRLKVISREIRIIK